MTESSQRATPTPMMAQYARIKSETPPGSILMFRLGDFYEMFGRDAVEAAPILGVTLTQRAGMPMCGVPWMAVDTYLAKLIRAGRTAALCDQAEDPKAAKKLVKREITRIVTPGTVTEEGLVDESANNWAAAVCGLGTAFLDLSTGEFFTEGFPDEARLREAMSRYAPAETLMPRPDDFHATPPRGVTYADAWTFSPGAAREELFRHFGVTSLDGFGLQDEPEQACAAGALLYYVNTTLRHRVDHVRTLRRRMNGDCMALDADALRNLSVLPAPGVPRNACLLGVLDATRTPMGARALRNRLTRPYGRAEDIEAQLDAVEFFTADRQALHDLRGLLGGVRDMERISAKISSGRANARDLQALAQSLRPVPAVKSALEARRPPAALAAAAEAMCPEDALVELVDRAIADQPPALTTEGDMIRAGYSAELDGLRAAAADGRRWIADYQTAEQQRTGIKTLRIRHNSVFGFYVEISKAAAASVPPEYERRQTVANAERFTTPALKEYESKVTGANERAVALEAELFRGIAAEACGRIASIQRTAGALGALDATLSLADRALALGYARPAIDSSRDLEIEDGRHPIVEQLPESEPFVPNSTRMDCTENQIHLITGPNMAGKSTYLRQVATIALMAHAGSFVPAARCRMGTIDRIFTRLGAADDLSRGRSTFLVEMQETANILNNATPASLIVLDEIGRGTSTFDGVSIAWSVAEYLHGCGKCKAKTLFATHYHELADLAQRLPGVKNYTVAVRESGGRVAFLRRIQPGVADKSYGIHVAAMAGLPRPVTERAAQILRNLEANELDVDAPKFLRRPRARLSDLPGQMTLL